MEIKNIKNILKLFQEKNSLKTKKMSFCNFQKGPVINFLLTPAFAETLENYIYQTFKDTFRYVELPDVNTSYGRLSDIIIIFLLYYF